MEICFLTKYPPIQGGVSVHCYWAARGLAERGHRVTVVTNADEVEDTFRIALSERERAPGGECQPRFPGSGGQVDVRSTRSPDRRELYYVPMGNPTVSRLATMATDVIRERGCAVIYSYYLEPYGVAAYLASRWTGVPFVFKHAGSDLHRLMNLPDLRTGYLEVLRAASRVISRGPSRRLLLEGGIDEHRITGTAGFSLPEEVFHPDHSVLPLGEWVPGIDEDSLPVLGVYGKLGQYKGSADLLHAMARLRSEGFDLHLLAASHGWQEARYRQLVDHLGLTDRVHLIPFLPHWRIPSFVRSCTAVAFLERDFPIRAHTPMIPLEVVSCAGCLVVSAEVARKQVFRGLLRDGRNAVVVPDPRRHEELAERLRYALSDPERARGIGAHGHAELMYERSYSQYIGELAELLTTVAAERPAAPARLVPPHTRPSGPTDALAAMARFYPYTRALLDDAGEELIRRSVTGRSLGRGATDPRALALDLGKALLAALPADGSVPAEVCRYEYTALVWGGPPAGDHRVDSQAWSDAPERRPRLAGEVEIAHFSRDIEAVASALDRGDPVPAAEGEVRVLFHPHAGPLRINTATEWLIGLLRPGSTTFADLRRAVAQRYGDGAVEECVDTVESLFWEGVVCLD